jgi:glucan 1,3-beta-glucosidase
VLILEDGLYLNRWSSIVVLILGLMIDSWITPSIFIDVGQSLGIIDEYTLCEQLPYEAPTILEKHWQSWVCFDDFQKIASAGMNVVSIPIGFWAFENYSTPYIKGRPITWKKQLVGLVEQTHR